MDNNVRFVSKIASVSPTDITTNIEKNFNANTHEKHLPELIKIL